MPLYECVSPVFTETEDLGWGGGPTYQVRDCELVEASDHSAAKWKFLAYCRQLGSEWTIDYYSHPLKGVSCKLYRGSAEDLREWDIIH